MDGDGSVSSRTNVLMASVSFYGMPIYLTGLKEKIVEYTGVTKEIKITKNGDTSNDLHVLSWSEKGDLLKLRDFLYPEGSYPFLLRKKRVLEEYLKTLNPLNPLSQRNNLTGLSGVSYNKKNSNWKSRINLKGKEINLGVYLNKFEAAYAYNQAFFILYNKPDRNIIPKDSIEINRQEEIKVNINEKLKCPLYQ
jgi:hypothetical protein